jgi:hypothetical protein
MLISYRLNSFHRAIGSSDHLNQPVVCWGIDERINRICRAIHNSEFTISFAFPLSFQ